MIDFDKACEENDEHRMAEAHYANYVRLCPVCRNRRWVCENHMDLPFDVPDGCACGAGAPCPACNATGSRLPEGAKVVLSK